MRPSTYNHVFRAFPENDEIRKHYDNIYKFLKICNIRTHHLRYFKSEITYRFKVQFKLQIWLQIL